MKKLAEAYYYDWFNIKEERDVLSSYVKNIEKYIFITIVLMIVLVVTFFFLKQYRGEVYTSNNAEINSVSLLNDQGKIIPQKLKTMSLITADIAHGKLANVYIIRNFRNTQIDEYKKIINAIKLFSDSTDIYEIFVEDIPIKSNIIIIKPTY